MQFIDELMSIVDPYAGLIIDQWGVLHNGREPYPGVHAVLDELKRRDKTIVLLTNSGRRTDYNRVRMGRMGFNLSNIDGIVTSGEAGWLALKLRDEPPYDQLGRACYLLTRGGDLGVVEGLDVDLVDEVTDAEFIFLTGVDSPPLTLDDYKSVMDAARAKELPVICSNPDRVAVSSRGLVTAPGTVADYYETIGGTVHYVGKPNRPIYSACLNHFAELELSEILAIGDSLEHDIKGANGAGVDSVFIASGIHAEKLSDPATRDAELDGLCQHYGARPTYVVPKFAL